MVPLIVKALRNSETSPFAMPLLNAAYVSVLGQDFSHIQISRFALFVLALCPTHFCQSSFYPDYLWISNGGRGIVNALLEVLYEV